MSFFVNEVLDRRFQERCTLTQRPWRKKGFQKKAEQILVDKRIQQKQQEEKKRFTLVSICRLSSLLL
jgi:hypothetical protein